MCHVCETNTQHTLVIGVPSNIQFPLRLFTEREMCNTELERKNTEFQPLPIAHLSSLIHTCIRFDCYATFKYKSLPDLQTSGRAEGKENKNKKRRLYTQSSQDEYFFWQKPSSTSPSTTSSMSQE